ncbi:MAG TPA: outer membrane lipoprotein chaperone LolA [Bacteroidota bacterium]|nr:outer membrane lipoprotein chaperone LolA [Bacteroidota bacterium]
MGRLVVALLVFTTLCSGQRKEYTVKEITDRMQKKYESIQDATAKFTQHVKFGFSKIEQSFSGTLRMKKPNHYRVETEYQTLVTDGTTVWSFSPVNKQVLIDRYKESSDSFTPEQFLLNLPSNYFATIVPPDAGSEKSTVMLKLVPKDDQSFIKSMKVWVDEATWVVKKVEMLDVNDTEKTYTVQDIKINTNLNNGTFAFTPPQGTEVVDLR